MDRERKKREKKGWKIERKKSKIMKEREREREREREGDEMIWKEIEPRKNWLRR